MKRFTFTFILLWLFGEVWLIGPGALDVYHTGMCPAGPPDIPPYPCSIFEYLARMFLSPFALGGQIFFLIAILVLSLMVDLLLRGVVHLLEKISKK